MTEQITIQVNGQPCTCYPDTPLPQILEKLGLNPRLVVVEYNGEIIQRQDWEQTQLKTGDRLEVVTIVGGG
jgi:sulfur carrier protein